MEKVDFEVVDIYKKWVEGQGIPVIRGYYVDDVMSIPLQPWSRMGGKGAYLDLFGAKNCTGAYICEIPPGGSLKPEKHLFEEMVYVLSGKGTASVWRGSLPKQSFEWQEGSLFSPPLNTWHQFFNTTDMPAKLFAVTGAPVFMNLFHNLDFIFNNDFVFEDRYAGQSDYFSGKVKALNMTEDGKPLPTALPALFDSSLFKNVLAVLKMSEAYAQEWRRGPSFKLTLSDNTMEAHIEEEPSGVFQKPHRHHGGAHLLILGGKGYSMMWHDGGEKHRFDWHKYSVLVPPEMWWHTHFITGGEPAITLALRWLGHKYAFNRDWKPGKPDILEYDEVDPEIMRQFEAELAKEGRQVKI